MSTKKNQLYVLGNFYGGEYPRFASLTKPNNSNWYELMDVDFEIEKDTQLIIVYVVYTSGSTFGRDETEHISLVEVVRTLDEAVKLRSEINSDNYQDKSGYDYLSWKGYFEEFLAAEFEVLTLVH